MFISTRTIFLKPNICFFPFFEWVAELGEEALILGDFNMERHVLAYFYCLSNGKVVFLR